jgi:hypothetical protein
MWRVPFSGDSIHLKHKPPQIVDEGETFKLGLKQPLSVLITHPVIFRILWVRDDVNVVGR